MPPKSPLACSPEPNTRTDPFLRSALRAHARLSAEVAIGQLPIDAVGAAFLFEAIDGGLGYSYRAEILPPREGPSND